MRALLLFARSRRWAINLAVFVICAALVVACGPLNYSLNPRGGFQITIAAQLPVIAALCIQASLGSPLRRQEQQAARRIGRWRVVHVVALTTAAAVLIGVAATQLDPGRLGLTHGATSVGSTALVRNLLAFTGIGLIGAVIVGESFAWVFPLAWSILPYVALPDPSADPSGIFVLATQPDTAFTPFVVAIAVWAVGVLVAARGIRTHL